MTKLETERPVRSIAIIGGGTAGWMSAAAISKSFGHKVDVVLIELEEIGIIGVGEATVPHLSAFNRLLQIDEAEFVRQTQGSFKLGIQFNDWGKIGDSYIHGFGAIGRDLGLMPFHQYWLKARALGQAKDIGEYSLNTVAAPLGKFDDSAQRRSAQFPAGGDRLRLSFRRGSLCALPAPVRRRSRRKADRRQGRRRHAARRERLRRERHAGERPSHRRRPVPRLHRLPGTDDRRHFRRRLRRLDEVAPVRSSRGCALRKGRAANALYPLHGAQIGMAVPYPSPAPNRQRPCLQQRIQSATMKRPTFSSRISTAGALGDPKLLRFKTGKRRKLWDRNVIAIGLAGGFLEPLESTAIYLIQAGINRLMNLFPTADCDPALQDVYNEQADFEYERIRDFLILHYHATERDDSDFWNYVRTMSIPDALKSHIELFAANGQFFRNGEELFGLTSWVQVMLGQGLYPRTYHPAVDWVEDKDMLALVGHVEKVLDASVRLMPQHEDFIQRCCAASNVRFQVAASHKF